MHKPIIMISNSDISLFKRCRRKWNLSSFNRRNLIPRQPDLKLWIGTGGHYALEKWYAGESDLLPAFEDWLKKEFERLKNELGSRATTEFWNDIDEVANMGRQVLDHYKHWAFKNDTIRFVRTEMEFSVPIPGVVLDLTDDEGNIASWVKNEWTDYWEDHPDFKTLWVDRGLYDPHEKTITPLYIGRLDGLVEDQNKDYWVIDHKFMARLIDPELLLLDEQTAKYVYAARESINNGWWKIAGVPQGATIRGAIYNVIRKKAPVIPAQLKSGRTSAAKSIDTTADVFRATLDLRGESYNDFQEVLDHLKDADKKFFQRIFVKRGQQELDLVGKRLHYEYRTMAEAAAHDYDIMNPFFYPTPDYTCKWSCSFREPCLLANYGADAEEVIQSSMISQDRSKLYATQVESMEDG